MPQRVVHQHQRRHGLGNGRRTDADARVVAAVRRDFRRVTVHVHAAPGETDARGRLEGDAEEDVLAGGDAADDATGVVGEESFRAHLVAVLGALLGHRLEPRADLDTLDGIDAHQRVRKLGVEPIEDRLAPPRRQTAGAHVDARTDGVAFLAQRIHEGFQFGHQRGIRAEERVALYLPGVEGVRTQRAELRQPALDAHAVTLREVLARDGAGGHPRGGLARR